VLVLTIAAAVGVTAYVVGGGDDTGWSEQDEKATLDFLQSGDQPDNKFDESEAACILEVYERYFPNYDDYNNAPEHSPTLLKANAAAGRRCFRSR
jgi:hypothetical protein